MYLGGNCRWVPLKNRQLQLVQNGAARSIARPGKHGHISPVLKELYWSQVL